MLDQPVGPRGVEAFYSGAAEHYDDLTAQYERAPKERAVALLARRPGERLLEVAVGTGMTFAAVLAASGDEHAVGVDFAPGMIAVSGRRVREATGRPAPILRGDARRLPFAAGTFDCVFNGYMLDLVPTPEIPGVLGEFARVLRPGGRLVLVNLTDGEGEDAPFSERWRARFVEDPVSLGACRPVRIAPLLPAAGFADVTREYHGGESWPSEVVTARRA